MRNPETIKLLKESLTGSLTGSLTSSIITEYTRILPDNGWLVLCQFANLRVNGNNFRALSVNDLDKIFRGKIHVNTIRSMIKKLIYKSYVKLWRDDWGKTRSEKTYIITTDGLLIYEKYKKEVLEYL